MVKSLESRVRDILDTSDPTMFRLSKPQASLLIAAAVRNLTYVHALETSCLARRLNLRMQSERNMPQWQEGAASGTNLYSSSMFMSIIPIYPHRNLHK